MRPLKDRTDTDRKILTAIVATVKIRNGFSRRIVLAFAIRTFDTVYPQDSGEIVDGGLLVGKLLHQFVGRKDFGNRLFRLGWHTVYTCPVGECWQNYRKKLRNADGEKGL